MPVRKRVILSVILLLSFIYLAGCETAKGAGVGVGSAVAYTAVGVGKDAGNTCNFIMALDNWIKKNLW